MKTLLFAITFLSIISAQAQVGMGSVANPTAQLEIQGDDRGIPILELNPQETPKGSVTGQLAVIGDKLFMFDEGRGKWLSVEFTMFNFGLAGSVDDQDLEFVGDVELSGPRMPFDGTIVYVTMNASSGQTNKKVQLNINGKVVPDDSDPSQDGLLELDSYSFTNTQYNLDFNAGDYIQVDVPDEGSAVQNLSVLLKVKWRK